MTSFVAELRRRNVLKVGTAYALVSWILIEAGSVLLPTFGAPEWFFKGYVLMIIAGFLLSLIFAWVLEWTPEGVKLEKDVNRSESVTHQTGSKLTYWIIALLAVALVISVTLNITGLREGAPVADISEDASSIAVLPFESRSTDPDNALFADGIHDDLLTSLAGIQALKVISRTSVLKYRNPTRNLPEIARELGVATVLEGSVARSGDNVRVNVQLILYAARFSVGTTAQRASAILSAEALTRLRAAFDEGFRGARLFENWNLDDDPYLESIRDTDEFRLVDSDIKAANDIMRRRVDGARERGNVEAILASTRRKSAANSSKIN